MSTFCLGWFLLCFCFPFYLDDPTCSGKVGAHVISTKDWMFIWPPPAKWSESIGGKTVPSEKSAHSILLVKSLCSVLMSLAGICCLFTGMDGYVISNASRDRFQTSYLGPHPLWATSEACMVSKWALRILLECSLVLWCVWETNQECCYCLAATP